MKRLSLLRTLLICVVTLTGFLKPGYLALQSSAVTSSVPTPPAVGLEESGYPDAQKLVITEVLPSPLPLAIAGFIDGQGLPLGHAFLDRPALSLSSIPVSQTTAPFVLEMTPGPTEPLMMRTDEQSSLTSMSLSPVAGSSQAPVFEICSDCLREMDRSAVPSPTPTPESNTLRLEVSFREAMAAGRLVRALGPYHFEVEQLLYRWGEHTGWYLAKPGEPLSTAADAFAKQHRAFLEEMITSEEGTLEDAAKRGFWMSSDTEKSQRNLLEDFQAQLQLLETSGLLLSGVTIAGRQVEIRKIEEFALLEGHTVNTKFIALAQVRVLSIKESHLRATLRIPVNLTNSVLPKANSNTTPVHTTLQVNSLGLTRVASTPHTGPTNTTYGYGARRTHTCVLEAEHTTATFRQHMSIHLSWTSTRCSRSVATGARAFRLIIFIIPESLSS